MTTITINERTKKGKLLLEFLKMTYQNESFVTFNEPNDETIAAFDDIAKGKVNRYKSSNDLFKSMGV